MTDTPTQGTVAAQLAALPSMPMAELWALWDEHFPRRPAHRNRSYVESRLAYRIQEKAYGALPTPIRRMLVEQVTGRVRWRESMEWMATEGGVTRFAEAGSGKVLSGMAKRIAPDAEATPLNTPADLEAFAASL